MSIPPTDTDPLVAVLRYPALLAKVALFALALSVVLSLVSALEGVLVPVLGALLFAYLLDPAVDAFEARGWSRTQAIGALLVGAVLVLAAFVLFLVPSIRSVIFRFIDGAPELLARLEATVFPWLSSVLGDAAPATFTELTGQVGAELEGVLPGLANQAMSWIASAWGSASSFASSLVNLLLLPFFAFYFLRDFDELKLEALSLVPPRHRAFVVDRASRADAVVGAWFRGQIEVASLLGLLYAVGLGVSFGSTDIGATAGIALGVLAGGLNFIPYVGTSVGIGLTFGLLLLDGAGWGPLVGAAATFALVQTLEGYVITPRIVGDKVGLSTVSVILALLIGGELFGLLGMLLALPVAGVLKAFTPDLLEAWRGSATYTGPEQELALEGE